jgi:hypothetical protein
MQYSGDSRGVTGQGKTLARYLYIDSQDQVSGGAKNNQRFVVEISNIGQSNLRGFEMSLQDMSFLNTHRTIHPYNKYLYFEESSNPGVIVRAEVVEGVYTSSTISAAVKTAMDAVADVGNTYTVAYSSTSQKLTITLDTGLPNTFEFKTYAQYGDYYDYTCYHMLGFDQSLFGVVNSDESDGILDLSGTKYVDIFTNLPTINASSNARRPFARVFLDVAYGYYFHYSNSDTDYNYLETNGLNIIEFDLYDDRGHPFDLSNNSFVHMTMKLRIQG